MPPNVNCPLAVVRWSFLPFRRIISSKATPESLDIVLSSMSSEIEVMVAYDKNQPAPAAQVALVPARGGDRAELFKWGTTDQNGRVVLRGVVPGQYTVFAWEAIEQYSWFDAEVLEQYRTSGRPLTVGESATTTIQIQAIP